MSYSKKLTDPRWQKKRLEILQRDNFTCTNCGDDKSTLHVHHEYYKGNPWDIENEFLKTLCDKCHSREHPIKIEFSSNTKNVNSNYVDANSQDLRAYSEEIYKAYKLIEQSKKNSIPSELKELRESLNQMCIAENLIIVDLGITYGLQNG